MITLEQYQNDPSLQRRFYKQFVDEKLIGRAREHYTVLQVCSMFAEDDQWVDKTDWMPMAAYVLAYDMHHYIKLFATYNVTFTLRTMAAVVREAVRMYSDSIISVVTMHMDEEDMNLL